MIDWFARNPVAANLLMFAIIIAGLTSASRSIPVEVLPSFANDTVAIATVFRGATPNSVEESVTNRVEEAIYDIEGISETNSSSSEGYSLVRAEIQSGYDRREILNKVKLRVDALNTLPDDTENPIVSLIETNQAVMQVAVMGDVNEKTLRLHADKVREDLLNNDQISLVDLIGVNNYEIGIELAPETLEKYDLSLAAVTQAIQRGSADVSAGNVQTRDGDILIRADGQAYTRIDFAKIPVISQLGADPILLGDIATITDGFEEQPLITKFNNKPAILMDVTRTGSQSSIEIADIVKRYIESENSNPVNNFELAYYDDDSQLIKSRLSTLIKSGIQGGILVLLLLSLFLRPAIAFWVFLGIPVSFMGAFIVMPWVGGSFNMMSLFAFIVVLGIVVDDAIVTGENIYRKMRDGLAPLEASIIGTKQIAIPVTFGILTTIVAFLPLFNMGNNRIGHLAAQIPMVVIPVLIFSLIESKFVLPAHLSHIKPRTESEKSSWLARTQMSISRGFEDAIVKHYQPFLEKSLRNKSVCLTSLLAVSAIVIAFAVNGHTKFTFFPRVESEEIKISLTMPDTTGFETTRAHINTIANHLTNLQNKHRDPHSGVSVIKHIYSSAGGRNQTVKPNIGYISAELYGPEDRLLPVTTSQIARELRELVGNIAGAEELSIVSSLGSTGSPIDIEISGADLADMRIVGERLRTQLQRYPSVYDIQDTFSGGKEELNIDLKPKARLLGLDLVTVASQIRGSIFGFEAQRLQRGREEVRVMVRLPLEYRSSMQDLMDLPIQIGQGLEPLPLSDLATITPQRSSNTLYKLNRQSIISVSSDVDKDVADVPAILRDLTAFLESQKELFPQLTYVFRGEAEEQSENNKGLLAGVFLIVICVYALLAIPFKSYTQPLIVMSIMPISVVSAVLGHIVVGFDLSMLSIVGFVALLGVVVNDSLVLVDYINQQRKRGMEVFDAVLTSGTVRFRPVILTSLTTFAGLTPLLLDSTTQSQFLKPMAVSLGFGILFSTIVTLVIVPVNYLFAYQSKQQARKLWAVWLEYWNREDVRP